MSNKRKTRKQKERLEQRRQRMLEVDGKKANAKKVTAANNKKADSSSEVLQDEDSRIAEKRLKLMKYSLGVFLVLVITQLAVWWLLRSDLLPQAWVELLLG